jgi:hypothetical protein
MILSDSNPALIPDLTRQDRFLLFDWYYAKLAAKLNEMIEHTAYLQHINKKDSNDNQV